MSTTKKGARKGSKKGTGKNAVTKTTEQLPAVFDYGDDFDAGFEDVSREEIGIPFIKILQAQSPEVIGPQGKIDGAAAGMFLNTGSGEMAKSITFVPAMRQHVFVEWTPRAKGGGIVAIHQPGDEVVAKAKAASEKFGKYTTPDGNELVETYYVFGVTLDTNGEPEGWCVVPFASTAIKKYRKQFMQRMNACMVTAPDGTKRKVPMYAHRIVMTTEQEQNEKGVWSNYHIEFLINNNVKESLMKPDHPAYETAKVLKAAVEGGEAQADLSKAERGDGETTGGTKFF